MKDVRLLRPLIEVMKIKRFAFLLSSMPHLLSPSPRLRHGRRLALLSLSPKSVYFLLRFVAGSFSHFPPLQSFPNCSSLKESASVFADYLRSHFSASQPKALGSKAKGYLSELRRATYPDESYLFFCSL